MMDVRISAPSSSLRLPALRRFLRAASSSSQQTLSAAKLASLALLTSALGVGCVAVDPPNPVALGGPPAKLLIVSVKDQKLTVLRTDGSRLYYPISTSKFGLGDHRRHYETPTGNLEIAQKVGGGAPAGAVFKGRVRTGEVIAANAPGRDPIVTRILALRGLDPNNRDALSRGIYIHGTPEERTIGTPSSYGCIRMRSKDVIEVYNIVNVGTRVQILDTTRNQALSGYNAPVPTAQQQPTALPSSSQSGASLAGGASQAEEAAAAASKTGETAAPPPPPSYPSRTARSRSAAPTTMAAAAPQPTSAAADKRQEWAGSPSRLLATKGNAAAPAPAPNASRTRGVVGNSRDTRPASNETESTDGNNGNARTRNLKRPALDAM